MAHYECEECGKPATFLARTRRYRVTGNQEHTLCRRCYHRLMDSVRAGEPPPEEPRPTWRDYQLRRIQ